MALKKMRAQQLIIFLEVRIALVCDSSPKLLGYLYNTIPTLLTTPSNRATAWGCNSKDK